MSIGYIISPIALVVWVISDVYEYFVFCAGDKFQKPIIVRLA